VLFFVLFVCKCVLPSRAFRALEVFPWLFLSCKTNARVKLTKTGHGPHSSTLFVICVVWLLFVLFFLLFVCECVLPSRDNPIARNKYIRYLKKGTIFVGVGSLKLKCVLLFCTNFDWNISHSQKKWARYYHKCALVFMFSTRYSCLILIKLQFTGHIFEKYSDIKFHENPSSGSRVIPCGTDRHEVTNSRFSQFLRRRPKIAIFNISDWQ
jgi:hypothetical protein